MCPGAYATDAGIGHMDLPLVIIGTLLMVSLTAFFTGVLPYPIGWIILSAAFIGRWLFLRAR